MIEEEGIVLSISGKVAKVQVLKKSACESCAAAGVCHAGSGDHAMLEAENPVAAKPGQRVKILITAQTYLYKNSLFRYGVPIACFIAGAILAKKATVHFGGSNTDLWALFAGIFCFALSFLGVTMYNQNVATAQVYKPVIVQIQADKQ